MLYSTKHFLPNFRSGTTCNISLQSTESESHQMTKLFMILWHLVRCAITHGTVGKEKTIIRTCFFTLYQTLSEIIAYLVMIDFHFQKKFAFFCLPKSIICLSFEKVWLKHMKDSH